MYTDFRTFALACAFTLAAGAAHAVPTFTNNSFEADNWTGQHLAIIPSGWTGATSGSFSRGYDNATAGSGAGTPVETPFGDQFVVIGSNDSNGNDFITQTLSGFVVGGVYDISFYMSPEFTDAGNINHVLDLTISGAVSTTTRFEIPGVADGSHGNLVWAYWEERTLEFTADATSLAFRFDGANDDGIAQCGYQFCRETGLDNLTLTQVSLPIPEPATLGLFGIGLVGIGAALRRRKAA